MIQKVFLTFFAVQLITYATTLIGMIVDGMVTGQFLGSDALAAYGLVTPFLTVITALATATSVGTATLVSTRLGKGDMEEMRKGFRISFWGILLFSVAIAALVFLLAGPIVTALKADGEIHRMAADYLRAYSVGYPAIFIVVLGMPVLQLIGRRVALISAIVIMTAVNVFLDFFNALAWHKGLMGMALATTISYYCALLIVLGAIQLKGSMLPLRWERPRLSVLWEMTVYGAPNAIALGCKNCLTIFLNTLIISIAGMKMVAAYTAIMTSANMAWCIGFGMASAVSMLTGVFEGEKDRLDLVTLTKLYIKYAVIFGGICTCIFIAFSPWFVSLFLKDQSLMEVASLGLKLVVLNVILFVINSCLRAYYQAMKLKITIPFAVFNCLVSTAIIAFALGHTVGLMGVWLAYPLGEALTLMVFGIYALWRTRKVKERSFLERLMLIPEKYYSDAGPVEIPVASMDDAVRASEEVRIYMREHGASDRIALYGALAVEELAGNVIQHGFNDGRRHHMMVKLKEDEQRWILRLRDDCRDFDPVAYVEGLTPEEQYSHYGIRMIYGLASEIRYLNTLHLNNLIIQFSES